MRDDKRCSVEGCVRPYAAKGFCQIHYDRLNHSGSVYTLEERGLLKTRQPCTSPGCGKLQKGRGLCATHYAQLHRSGAVTDRPCSHEGCKNKVYAKELCANHYRAELEASPGYREAHPCSAPGCDRAARNNGMCQKHNKRMRRFGSLGEPPPGPGRPGARPGSAGHIDPTPDARPGKSGFLAVNVLNDIKQKALQKSNHNSDRKERRAAGWWALSVDQAYRLIVGECFYCGAASGWPKTRNGIDRVACKIGYTVENCVTACWRCNAAKNEQTVAEFRTWLTRAYRHFVQPS